LIIREKKRTSTPVYLRFRSYVFYHCVRIRNELNTKYTTAQRTL